MKAVTSISTACAKRRRAPERNTDVKGSSENDPGWRSSTTLSSLMAYPFLMGIGDSVSPGYAAFNSSRHQLSGIAQQEVASPGRLAPDRRHHSRRQIQGRRKANRTRRLKPASPTFDGAVKSRWPTGVLAVVFPVPRRINRSVFALALHEHPIFCGSSRWCFDFHGPMAAQRQILRPRARRWTT